LLPTGSFIRSNYTDEGWKDASKANKAAACFAILIIFSIVVVRLLDLDHNVMR